MFCQNDGKGVFWPLVARLNMIITRTDNFEKKFISRYSSCMFQSPLEDFPSKVINRRNLVEQDLAPPVNHCYGKDFLLAIADKLDGITPPPAPPSNNPFDEDRLGLMLNQITVNPNPKFNQQPGTMGKDRPQPKRFIVEPKTIALIERITGRIDDLDVPHQPDSYDDEQSSEGEEAQVQKEKSVVAVASKKPKKIRPISENSNLLKYTSSSLSKIKGPHPDYNMVEESKNVKKSAKISSNSDIHDRLYQDGMRQKEARESASSLANLPKPIVSSPLESLQKIKNELLTVHSINQRKQKPKHNFHEANLKRIKETQRVSQESLERRQVKFQSSTSI